MARRVDLHSKAEYICADLSSQPNFSLAVLRRTIHFQDQLLCTKIIDKPSRVCDLIRRNLKLIDAYPHKFKPHSFTSPSVHGSDRARAGRSIDWLQLIRTGWNIQLIADKLEKFAYGKSRVQLMSVLQPQAKRFLATD